MMLWKCCTPYASKFGKLSSGHRTGKGQVSFQSQRKAMPKNVQTNSQLRSSHTLALRNAQNSPSRFQQYVNWELPDVQAGFRKGRGTRDEIATSIGLLKKRESSRKTSTFALLTMPKPLYKSQQTVENSSSDGNTRPVDLPSVKSVCRSRSNS